MNKFILFLLSILLTACVSEPDPQDEWSLPVGSEMPRFEVARTDGSVVHSEDLKGKQSMIVLFNTSCADCREELPIIQQLYDEKKEEINFLCISRSQDKPSVIQYWREHNLTLPVSAQPNKYIYNLFARSVIPRIFIFNSEGILTASFSDSPLPTLTDLQSALSNKD